VTKDDYLRIAREHDFPWFGIEQVDAFRKMEEERIIAFASAIAALEREECAKLCYEHAMEAWDHEGGSLWCAAAIRNKEK
jgi:hypothetical protein